MPCYSSALWTDSFHGSALYIYHCSLPVLCTTLLATAACQRCSHCCLPTFFVAAAYCLPPLLATAAYLCLLPLIPLLLLTTAAYHCCVTRVACHCCPLRSIPLLFTHAPLLRTSTACRCFCTAAYHCHLPPLVTTVEYHSSATLCLPPAPLELSLGLKSIGNARRRRKIFFRLYWNCCFLSATIVWCNPPHPPTPAGGAVTTLGGDFKGGRLPLLLAGAASHCSYHSCFNNSVLPLLLPPSAPLLPLVLATATFLPCS